MYLLRDRGLIWCDLHGHDNELVTVYDHEHIENNVRIEKNGKVFSIKSIGISGTVPKTLNSYKTADIPLSLFDL